MTNLECTPLPAVELILQDGTHLKIWANGVVEGGDGIQIINRIMPMLNQICGTLIKDAKLTSDAIQSWMIAP